MAIARQISSLIAMKNAQHMLQHSLRCVAFGGEKKQEEVEKVKCIAYQAHKGLRHLDPWTFPVLT